MFEYGNIFCDSGLGTWYLPDPVQQFSNPYIGMANNPTRFTDLTGTTAVVADTEGGGGGANSNDDDDDEEEEPEGDPGDGIVLGWDGGYHGGRIGVPPFRASTFFSGRTLHYGQISWLNDIGAINGSFAPVMSNGKMIYYNAKKGTFGYEKESVQQDGTAFRVATYENGVEVVAAMPLYSVVNEWVVLGGGQSGQGTFQYNQSISEAITGLGGTTGLLQYSADAVERGFHINPFINKISFGNANIIGKIRRVAGGGLAFGGLAYSVYALSQDGYSDQDMARLTAQAIITGIAFLGPIGLGVSVGLSIIDTAGGFDWLYSNFDNTNNAFE